MFSQKKHAAWLAGRATLRNCLMTAEDKPQKVVPQNDGMLPWCLSGLFTECCPVFASSQSKSHKANKEKEKSGHKQQTQAAGVPYPY